MRIELEHGETTMAIGKIYQPPEMELNFSTDWDLMPQDVKVAFRGKRKRVKLESGFMLYKFTGFDLADQQGKITEWWSPVHSYDMAPGLAARIDLARTFGVSPAELTRVVAAVREDWNPLTHLLRARLLMPVWCLWGQCATQPRRTPAKGIPMARPANLPGYAWQFYIPRLTYVHIVRVSRDRVG
jgi:hypothetical protein